MPLIRHLDEEDNVPNEGKGTWILGNIALRQQNSAASSFYGTVKTLSQQDLDRPFTWYTSKGLAEDMIRRVVTSMEDHGWNDRLARDGHSQQEKASKGTRDLVWPPIAFRKYVGGFTLLRFWCDP
ncbi:hypothetical protein BZA05DRAFT_448249 [Tricharina praecox]|uniref:uncharacterized protein n=1 Tax=Tricharina praecox TaxID=43433 RepID=UPI00221FE19F|nr:uncharacterized protein BZA05DRAFT_448249 [Tricharina praecox]KAI5844753.1 hypothetical protein BZA05DRAFT_448249 [Tricharina praecox]